MNLNDMQTWSYALGFVLILISVIGIARVLRTPKSGRTYGASLDTDY
jgi:hypothetical protein